MKKELSRKIELELYHFKNGERLVGNCTELRGDCSGLSGNCSELI